MCRLNDTSMEHIDADINDVIIIVTEFRPTDLISGAVPDISVGIRR